MVCLFISFCLCFFPSSFVSLFLSGLFLSIVCDLFKALSINSVLVHVSWFSKFGYFSGLEVWEWEWGGGRGGVCLFTCCELLTLMAVVMVVVVVVVVLFAQCSAQADTD